MGFLSKIKKGFDVASTISNIAGKLDIQNVAGINLSNLSIDSLGSIKSQIESNLISQMTGLTTDLNGALNIGDLESQVTSMTNDLQNSINLDDLTGLSTSTNFGDINDLDLNSLINFDPVNFM